MIGKGQGHGLSLYGSGLPSPKTKVAISLPTNPIYRGPRRRRAAPLVTRFGVRLGLAIKAPDPTVKVPNSAAWIRGVCSDEPDTRRVCATRASGSSDAPDDVRRMVKIVTPAGDPAQAMAYGRPDRANDGPDGHVRRAP